MTSNEMADELELLLDRSFTYGSPGYEDFELSSFLNNAQQYFIKQQYDELVNKKRQGFEETEIRSQNLAELIRWANCPVSADQTGILQNGTFFDLPDNFMYTIYEEAELNVLCGDTPKMAIVKPVGHHEINRLKFNKYKKPKASGLEALVWRTQFSRFDDFSTLPVTAKRHQLITDGTFNVNNYRINYLRIAPEIVVDRVTVINQRNCVLDESTHILIVNIARDLALETVKEQKLTNIIPASDLE